MSLPGVARNLLGFVVERLETLQMSSYDYISVTIFLCECIDNRLFTPVIGRIAV